MAAWWANDLRLGSGNRSDRTHAELALHLVGEFLTAATLVVSGLVRISPGAEANAFVAAGLGMLLDTTIVSPGYFLARREYPAVGMFGVLVVLTLAALFTICT